MRQFTAGRLFSPLQPFLPASHEPVRTRSRPYANEDLGATWVHVYCALLFFVGEFGLRRQRDAESGFVAEMWSEAVAETKWRLRLLDRNEVQVVQAERNQEKESGGYGCSTETKCRSCTPSGTKKERKSVLLKRGRIVDK